jgi:hypothetical protein
LRDPFDRLRQPGLFGAGLLALAILVACARAPAVDFPTRKEGVWETTMTMNGGAPVVQKMCFTPDVEKKIEAAKAASCSRYEMRKEGAAFIVESTCTVLGTVIPVLPVALDRLVPDCLEVADLRLRSDVPSAEHRDVGDRSLERLFRGVGRVDAGEGGVLETDETDRYSLRRQHLRQIQGVAAAQAAAADAKQADGAALA